MLLPVFSLYNVQPTTLTFLTRIYVMYVEDMLEGGLLPTGLIVRKISIYNKIVWRQKLVARKLRALPMLASRFLRTYGGTPPTSYIGSRRNSSASKLSTTRGTKCGTTWEVAKVCSDK
jgi:hypothetical protein